MESDRIPPNEIPGPPVGNARLFAPAGFGSRLAALIIDYIVMSFPTMLAGLFGSYSVVIVVSILTAVAYKPIMESQLGLTFGKGIMRISVLTTDGLRPNLASAFLRNLFFFMPVFPYAVITERMLQANIEPGDQEAINQFALENSPMIWFFLLLFSLYLISCFFVLLHNKNRALHDLISGTQVVSYR